MRYVALLRGINVGGNALVKMSDLKKSYEDAGMKNVRTYINSGNIIFESDIKDISKIKQLLGEKFATLIIPENDYKTIMQQVPKIWQTKKDIRCYVAFLFPPITPSEVAAKVKLKEDVDSIDLGKNVVYMTTLMSGLTKSGFTKLVGTKIYRSMTMRNYTTCLKLFALLQSIPCSDMVNT